MNRTPVSELHKVTLLWGVFDLAHVSTIRSSRITFHVMLARVTTVSARCAGICSLLLASAIYTVPPLTCARTWQVSWGLSAGGVEWPRQVANHLWCAKLGHFRKARTLPLRNSIQPCPELASAFWFCSPVFLCLAPSYVMRPARRETSAVRWNVSCPHADTCANLARHQALTGSKHPVETRRTQECAVHKRGWTCFYSSFLGWKGLKKGRLSVHHKPVWVGDTSSCWPDIQ